MSQPSILIVDDDPDQLELFSIMLRRLPCAVRTAENGPQALQILHDAPAAVVLLDVAMPHMDGLAVLRAVRGDAELRTVKVILFTAWPDRIGPLDAALADKVLAKPTLRATLEQGVRDVLGGTVHLQ